MLLSVISGLSSECKEREKSALLTLHEVSGA